MAKERTIDWYKQAVRNGLRFREKYAGSRDWPQYKSYYRHNFKDGVIPVNLVFSILRSIIPQTYFNDPKATVTATRPGIEYELHGRLVEDIDNWLIREVAVKQQIKRMIADAFLCGIANGFSGYDSQYGYSGEHSISEDTDATLTQFDVKGNRIEYYSHVNPGMPWFLRARPEDVVYPWGCEGVSNAEWVAMRVFRPLQDIKKDKKYRNTKDLAGSFTQRRTEASGTDSSELDGQLTDHEWVELWQVHDAKTKEIIGLTMNHDDFLRKGTDDSQIEGLPVESLAFNPDPDYIYGIPDAKIIEPQLLELNEIRTQAMRHRRIDILKLLYKKGVITKDAVNKLMSEHVQAAVEVDMDGSLRDAVLPLSPGASGILADMERAGEVVRSDVREVVGFSRVSTGNYQGKTHVTKAETDVVQWAGQIRMDERRDMVADLLTNIIRKFNQTIFSHWKTPMVRSIVGPDGARWWIQFTGDQIRGEYTYKVDPSNAVPTDPRTKRQEAVEMARGWAEMNQGLIQQGMPVPTEIQRAFFSNFDGIDMDKLMAQLGQGSQFGAGQNPNQAVPPNVAAQLMARSKNGAQTSGGNMSAARLL